MIIGCDIDHTITDYEELETEYVLRYLKEIGFYGKIVKPNEFFVLARFGFSDHDCWNFYDSFGAEIALNSPIKKDCDKIIHSLRESGDKFIFITARGETHLISHNPYVLTHKWMKKSGIEYDKLICRDHSKVDIAIKNNVDLFIDDSINVCKRLSERGVPTILVSATHNKEEKELPKGCTRAENWQEVQKIILKLKEEKENLTK
ncbi:MAG: hypothetical protein IJS68_03675 [Clostridia bacterium]|nr:hypothetical protein [Clostridia bacterium]